MIRCKIEHLEERARQRGKTLAEVTPCIVERNDDHIVVDPMHEAYPRSQELPPGALERMKNFASASAQHIAAGMPRASDEEIARRFDICQVCEFFDGKSCTKCGCGISRDAKHLSKLAWSDQSCPVGKWGKVIG